MLPKIPKRVCKCGAVENKYDEKRRFTVDGRCPRCYYRDYRKNRIQKKGNCEECGKEAVLIKNLCNHCNYEFRLKPYRPKK